MKPTALLLAAFLAACSPLPDADAPAPAPKVEAIPRAVINSDGPYAGRIEVKITYQRDYDYSLHTGFATGTVSANGTSWTNRATVGPTYDRAFVCPALWVYLGKPNGGGGYTTIVDVSGLYPYSTHLDRGTWRDPTTGFDVQQVVDCSYKVDNIGINRTQNIAYTLWVGLDCNQGGFGGYLPGHSSDLATAIPYYSWNLVPSTPPDGPGPRYMMRQAGPGPYGAHALWLNASYACGATSRRMPGPTTLANVVTCASFYVAGFCNGWWNLGALQWN